MDAVNIQLEPELEIQTVTLDAAQCRSLARVYFRWAKQLYLKADALDVRAGLWPARRVRRRARFPRCPR